MTCRKHFFLLAMLTLGLHGSMSLADGDQAPKTEPIKLGMAKSFFTDIPKIFVAIATEPFAGLMKMTTGLDGQLNTEFDAFEVAQKLNEGKLQLGVFHGHEFAWVKQRYPQLTPLMVAVNKHHEVRVFIVVNKNSTAQKLADLRGKKLDMAFATKEHCRVYLQKNCQDNDRNTPAAYFGSIVQSPTPEAALDDVCRGKVDAAIVDTIALEFYKDIKAPCFYKNLKILQESEPFPPAVIVYKPGVLPEATLKQFHDGLVNAHKNRQGEDMMRMWNIKAFEPIPETYTKSLADVLKAYPAPQVRKMSLRQA